MIELKDLKYAYRKKHPLFTGLNLELQGGFIYGLLGKNGAGKSTLLRLLSGLLFPKAGKSTVFGHKAADRKPAMLQDLYMVPEEFDLPPVSIETYGKLNAVFYSRFNHEQFRKYLDEFELPGHVKVSTLSYGQKKKFLIAFGLATNARVLILDEPTNGLDIPSKSQFRKTLASALTEEKIIIISTHQVRDLENLIDVVLVLEKGNIIFNRNLAEVSEKLAFEENLAGIPEEEVLYGEEMGGRRSGILRNISGVESRTDLELLFNGIIKDPAGINAAFNKHKS
jgi:ABC-2 type transport system ATP-binding protein